MLFVYGTLLSGITSNIAGFLHRNSRLIGQASVPGRLYDLGHYPGLWHGPASTRTTYGELLELYQPELTLQALDSYEGIGEHGAEVTEFAREWIVARLSNGREVHCWCYVLTFLPARAFFTPAALFVFLAAFFLILCHHYRKRESEAQGRRIGINAGPVFLHVLLRLEYTAAGTTLAGVLFLTDLNNDKDNTQALTRR